MRLSTAISLGRAVVTPKAGVLLEESGAGCALGMAGVASGAFVLGKQGHFTKIQEAFPWAVKTDCEIQPCKCRYFSGYKIGGMVGHLFDRHVMELKDWTLDQLIDWVRSVEPVEEKPQEAQATETVQRGELIAVEK